MNERINAWMNTWLVTEDGLSEDREYDAIDIMDDEDDDDPGLPEQHDNDYNVYGNSRYDDNAACHLRHYDNVDNIFFFFKFYNSDDIDHPSSQDMTIMNIITLV